MNIGKSKDLFINTNAIALHHGLVHGFAVKRDDGTVAVDGAAGDVRDAETPAQVGQLNIGVLSAGVSQNLDPLIHRLEVVHVVIDLFALEDDGRGSGLLLNAGQGQFIRAGRRPVRSQ